MPVSKKRKKDGKPVHRSRPVAAAEGEAPESGPAPAEPAAPARRAGKPSNPFVAMQQGRRGSQRGR
jgi:hypothetical protein